MSGNEIIGDGIILDRSDIRHDLLFSQSSLPVEFRDEALEDTDLDIDVTVLEEKEISPCTLKQVNVYNLTPEYVEQVISLLGNDPLVAFKVWEGNLLRNYINNPEQYPDILAFIALGEEGDIAGVLLGSLGFRATVNHVIVSPEFKGNGVGRMLMYHAEQKALLMGVERAVLTITAENNDRQAARGFYENLDYTVQKGEVTLEKDLS